MEEQSTKVSLLVIYENGDEAKLKIKDVNGQICDTIDLAVLDYMLASYGSMERYLEEAFKNQWIGSKNVVLRIIGQDGVIYPLPFTTKYNDIIFKASEAAIARGNKIYIEKGEENRTVSSSEFHEFFNLFLMNALSDEGWNLIQNDYFKKYPAFSALLEEYHDLSSKEDNIYTQARANQLEKYFSLGNDISSPRNPKTIDDFLRNYSIFRRAVSFNIKCLSDKNIMMRHEMENRKETQKQEGNQNGCIRSLCYIIGNNCAPLVLKTMEAVELDDYIMDHYEDAGQIRKENKEMIESYILSHKDYVAQIRKLIHDANYSGQLTILEHSPNGSFRRISNGKYLRLPLLFTKTFKNIRNLYCNVDKFRSQARKKRKELQQLDERISAEKAKYAYQQLEENLKKALEELQEEKKVTQKELDQVLSNIKRIVEDMKNLVQQDDIASKKPNYHRLFSEHIAREVRFAKATRIGSNYKRTLDEWAAAIENSPYRYDNLRSILRYLRKKEPIFSSTNKKVSKIEESPVEGTIKEEESFLTLEELNAMYNGELPSQKELERKNIHVQK